MCLFMIKIDIKENVDKYSNVVIVDITGINERNEYCRLSPFYPHGDIPLPNTPNEKAESVNDVWQCLCVKMDESVMWKKGRLIDEYWDYVDARKNILIPIYCWMLENKAYDIVEYLRVLMEKKTILIVDRTVNAEIENIKESFSCAFLLKAYIEASWPYEDAMKDEIEFRYVMQGRREICLKSRIRMPNKISQIYVGSQRILDF